jgi:hypothetical protein
MEKSSIMVLFPLDIGFDDIIEAVVNRRDGGM